MKIIINGEDINNIEIKKEGKYNVLKIDDIEIELNKETTEMLMNAMYDFCENDLLEKIKNKLEG